MTYPTPHSKHLPAHHITWDSAISRQAAPPPATQFDQGNPVRRKTRTQYWLTAGWGNSTWTVSASLINPFRSHWRTDALMIDTPYYSMQTDGINVNEHRRINLTVAYTFGYGKKISRGNDLQGVSGNASSIR